MKEFIVPQSFRDKTLAAFLRTVMREYSWSQIKQLIQNGYVFVKKKKCDKAAHRLYGNEFVAVHAHTDPKQHAKKRPKPQIPILHIDRDIVVIEKPEGITTIRHPEEIQEYGKKAKFLPKTVQELLPQVIVRAFPKEKKRAGTPPSVKAIHRLDKETSGVMVFARNHAAASHLGKQFRDHTVKRTYRAVVIGSVQSQTVETLISRDRGDGIRGSSPYTGKKAITHITVIEDLGSYSIVDCVLETGRTHQIRIHLAELGHPVCGEKLYTKCFKKRKIKDTSASHRLMLHAYTLGFIHPRTKRYIEFSSAIPTDMEKLIKNNT